VAKMADWFRMPFGIVSGVSQGIGVDVLQGEEGISRSFGEFSSPLI